MVVGGWIGTRVIIIWIRIASIHEHLLNVTRDE